MTDAKKPVLKLAHGPTELEWWTDHLEVGQTMHLLLRAGTLTQEEVKYYLEKPWKWDKERAFARKLESFMAENGVDAAKGWGMTMRAVAEAGLPR